jgi:hypothetical protein
MSSRGSADPRRRLPEICRFYGIVIKLFWNDHGPAQILCGRNEKDEEDGNDDKDTGA